MRKTVLPYVMLPAAAQVGLPNPPGPIELRGEWFRVLAVSPFSAAGGGGVVSGYPMIPTPTFPPGVVRQHPLYIRRGRYPLRLLLDGQPLTLVGSDWQPRDKHGSSILTFLGNDQSDAAMAAVAGGSAGGNYGPLAPGLAYQYVIEATPELVPDVQIAHPDEEAQSQFQKAISLKAATWSLLDYSMPRCFDRHQVVVQNNGPNPILVATLGDYDLIGVANFAPAPPGAIILDAAQAPGKPGGSITLPLGWGASLWGQATVADQTAMGGATVVTET